MSDIQSKVLILGSGPAGCTAAIYAARAMLEPVVVAGMQPGGQLTITTEVENYPGFATAIQGPWLMEQMQAQAAHVGTKIVQDTIASVDLARRPFTLIGDSGDRYSAEALIIATEWSEFANVDLAIVKEKMRTPIVFDGRNLLDPETMGRLGFHYHSIGRAGVKLG